VAIKRGEHLKTGRSGRTKPVEPVKNVRAGKDQYISRAVAKALEILQILQSGNGPMALNDVARRLQLSKTSAFRLLRTLEASGCLTASELGKYALAPGVHSAVSTQTVARLLRAGIPQMQQLSRQFRETTSMAALFENRIEVIAVVESPQPLRLSNIVGHILPPNASSLSKVITAFQNEERREKLLRSYGIYPFTEKTITHRTDLEQEFVRIREQKYATDLEESVRDGHCFGVPIFSAAGEVGAAISLSLPKARVLDAEHQKKILAGLRAAADQIASDLIGD
jgi:IclR family acetate operon transcriptional repressor